MYTEGNICNKNKNCLTNIQNIQLGSNKPLDH